MAPGEAGAATLRGRVAVVAGGTRGAGRGIAVALGTRGATVYVTGRSSEAGLSELGRGETIEETARLVDAAGGRGIAMRCDHMIVAEVEALRDRGRARGRAARRTRQRHLGRRCARALGRAVLGARSGGRPTGLAQRRRDAPDHVAQARPAARRDRRQTRNRGHRRRRRPLLRLALLRPREGLGDPPRDSPQASELAAHGVAAVALTPGFLRSEAMLDLFGVEEATWREAIAKDPHFALSETPAYVGRAVAALAADAVSSAGTAARSRPGGSRASTASRTTTARAPTGAAGGTRSW